MEEYYYYKRSCHGHVPAFGSWDWNNDLPFTQCFESATQPPGYLPYSFDSEERDLYVAGDLYENDVVTPAVIVVPARRRRKASREHVGNRGKEISKKQSEYECEWEAEPPLPSPTPQQRRAITPKPVDEDLYKISPTDLHYTQTKKKRGRGFFSSCLLPTCVL